jgi:hypothetical protein
MGESTMNAAIIMAAMVAAASVNTDSQAAALRATVGPWRLSAIGGKIGCTVALTDRESRGGHDLQSPAACQRAFPPLKVLSVWSMDSRGSLVFSDPLRRHVVAFSGPMGGPYAAVAPDGRAWRLALATARNPVESTP